MYMVVSRWEVDEADRDTFTDRALVVRDAARSLPGIVDVTGFYSEEGVAIMVLTFISEAAYSQIYAATDSPFAIAIEEQRLDRVGRWLNSERGELVV